MESKYVFNDHLVIFLFLEVQTFLLITYTWDFCKYQRDYYY